MPTQWEYKLEELSSDVATVTQHLNDESADGWDLVTALPADSSSASSSQRLVFRREVTNPTWDQ